MRDFSNHATDRPAGHDVAITDIEAAVVDGNFEWNLVKIHTDAGMTGIGEAYRGGGVPDLVEYTNRFLRGENPLDVERVFRRVVQEMSGHGGTTGKVVTAASGIEIALWDVAGKVLDLPVYQLLGSKYRDRVRLYCDCHAGRAYAVDEAGATEYGDADAYTPEAYAETAERVRELGFDALKFDLDMARDNDPDPYNGRLTSDAIRHKVEVVEAVREAVGHADLAFDCHWDYTVESATRLARKLEPYDLMWLEDVVPPEETEAQREVARRTATPLAAGENRFRVHELAELLDGYAIDVVTPDPTTCGGLAESKRIADRAEERYVPFSPHNVCSPVGTMACVHLCAAVPNADVLEYHSLEVDWWADLLERDRPIIEDGHVEVPTGPGLGVELDEAVVDAHLLAGTDGFE